MALVLAIEPDPRQAGTVKRIVRAMTGVELVLVDSKDAALEAIGRQLPDLILATTLLSPRHEADLRACLQAREDAVHVQTVTIPLLAPPTHAKSEKTRVFGVLKRKQKTAPVVGCDPDVFADEIAGYLEQAFEVKDEADRRRTEARAAAEAERRREEALQAQAEAEAARAAEEEAAWSGGWNRIAASQSGEELTPEPSSIVMAAPAEYRDLTIDTSVTAAHAPETVAFDPPAISSELFTPLESDALSAVMAPAPIEAQAVAIEEEPTQLPHIEPTLEAREELAPAPAGPASPPAEPAEDGDEWLDTLGLVLEGFHPESLQVEAGDAIPAAVAEPQGDPAETLAAAARTLEPPDLPVPDERLTVAADVMPETALKPEAHEAYSETWLSPPKEELTHADRLWLDLEIEALQMELESAAGASESVDDEWLRLGEGEPEPSDDEPGRRSRAREKEHAKKEANAISPAAAAEASPAASPAPTPKQATESLVTVDEVVAENPVWETAIDQPVATDPVAESAIDEAIATAPVTEPAIDEVVATTVVAEPAIDEVLAADPVAEPAAAPDVQVTTEAPPTPTAAPEAPRRKPLRPRKALPLASWTRKETQFALPPPPSAADDLRALMNGLSVPGAVAGVTYAKGCRIRRVIIATPSKLPAAGQPLIIVSRRALVQLRAPLEEREAIAV